MRTSVIKKGRVNIETLYLVEKGALLFLSINLIAASLGIDKLSWSENSNTEFVFGWSTWTQTDTSKSGVIVIRNRAYSDSDCAVASCDPSEHAGIIFFVLNTMGIILLACCCIIHLEMAVFHYTNTSKKIINAFFAVLAFTFNLTAWCFWTATSDTTEISKTNAGGATRHASSFWYCVFACFFLFIYTILVLKQNFTNCMDKRKLRDEVRPLPAANVPTARDGRGHQAKDINKLLQSRIIIVDNEPAHLTFPDPPGKLATDSEDEQVNDVHTQTPIVSSNNLPPPLPPRTSYVTPVVRLSSSTPGLPRRRSRGLPSVRTPSVVLKEEIVESADEDVSIGEVI